MGDVRQVIFNWFYYSLQAVICFLFTSMPYHHKYYNTDSHWSGSKLVISYENQTCQLSGQILEIKQCCLETWGCSFMSKGTMFCRCTIYAFNNVPTVRYRIFVGILSSLLVCLCLIVWSMKQEKAEPAFGRLSKPIDSDITTSGFAKNKLSNHESASITRFTSWRMFQREFMFIT